MRRSDPGYAPKSVRRYQGARWQPISRQYTRSGGEVHAAKFAVVPGPLGGYKDWMPACGGSMKGGRPMSPKISAPITCPSCIKLLEAQKGGNGERPTL